MEINLDNLENTSLELDPALEPKVVPNINAKLDNLESDKLDTEKAYEETAKENPDRVADVINIQEKTGEPSSFVEKNLDTLKPLSNAPARKYWEDLEQRYPGTTKWLGNPQNMALAKDDIDAMSKVEDSAKEASISSLIYNAGITGAINLEAGILRVPAFLQDFATLTPNILANMAGREDLQITTKDAFGFKGLEESAQWWEEQAKKFSLPELDSSITELAGRGEYKKAGRTLLAQVVANAPQQIPLLLTMASGYGAVGLAGMGLLSAGQANKEGKESGQIKSTINATAHGAFEVLFEKLGTGTVFKSIEKNLAKTMSKDSASKVAKDFAKYLFLYSGGEGLEEVGTSLAQDVSSAVTGVDENATEGMLRRAIDAGLVGWGSGITMTAPGAMISGIQRGQRLKQVKNTKNTYLSLGKSIEATKLRERLPSKSRDFVDNIVKGTEVENVYIDPEATDKFFQSQDQSAEEAFRELGLEKEYEESKRTGGPIKVPLADWANKFIGTDIYTGLSGDISFSQNDLTFNQVEASKKEASDIIQKEIDTVEDKEKLAEYEKIALKHYQEQLSKATGLPSGLKAQYKDQLALASRVASVQAITFGSWCQV